MADIRDAALATECVHAGEKRDKHGHALTDAVFLTSTFTFANTDDVIHFLNEKTPRDEYGRYSNPNERAVEEKLAALEGGESAVLFSSGMAAISALFLAKLNQGDEIVVFDECYHRTREFCLKHLSRFGIETKVVRTGDYEALAGAITDRTRLLFTESPTNPHMSVIDLEKFASIGRKHRIETVVDATIATPVNLRPLDWGVDYVLHSATKYLGGHNDLLAGVIVASEDRLEPVRKFRGLMGAVSSPHSCYLLQRGLKTLSLRMAQHNRNGQAIAEFLAKDPRIEKVYYPGLAEDPYHAVAKKVMRGYGGLLSFVVKGGAGPASRLVDNVKIPRIGPSLGGVESLIEQPMVMSHYHLTCEERSAIGIEDGLIRMAAGIEDTEDLISDLAQALDQIQPERNPLA